MSGPRLLRSGVRAARERGPLFALGVGLRWATFPLWGPRMRRTGRTFCLAGETYPYFLHNYNVTWSNERTVEVPVVRRLLERHAGRTVLEVGNVLSHYAAVGHAVVDKYERAAGVLNVDVADFDPRQRFDLIVSISTLEHVGFDERPRDPDKPRRALERLRGLLAPGGLMCVTLPAGYNPHLDRMLERSQVTWGRLLAMRRVSDDNAWEETGWQEALSLPWRRRWLGASSVLFGFIEAEWSAP